METQAHRDEISSPPRLRYRTDAQIGELLRLEMWRQRMPQQRLAEALGIDQAAVSRRMRGEIAWRLGDLNVAADLLGLDVTTFVATAEQPPAEVTA